MKAYNMNYLGRIHENKNQELKYLPPLSDVERIVEKETINCCPLCGEKKYIVVGKIPINVIIDNWVNSYGINPISNIYKNSILEKRYCTNCGLYFYNYHLPDFEKMYNELSTKVSYYPSYRPEYGIATECIENIKPNSLLEIGCGDGSFLERINGLVENTIGSEYNIEAQKICKDKGLTVICEDLSTIKQKFDVICHFEVFEHVFDTCKFLDKTLGLLKKGGKLIIGTPDPEGINSIIGRFALNLPPHHQFDFSLKCFKWIAKKYNLKILNYRKTELGYHHYARYVKILTGKELEAIDILGFYETQKKYSGQSHVVVFEKD